MAKYEENSFIQLLWDYIRDENLLLATFVIPNAID